MLDTYNENRISKCRKVLGIFIPFFIVQIIWWSYMLNNLQIFNTIFIDPVGNYNLPRYIMTIVMIFGSMIAGATSEGGASVAFPVMTLALNISPVIARDFSFMIQSVGMTAAAFNIILIKLQLEWKTIIWSSLGGICGLIFGLELIAPYLPPPFSKMYFVVIWAAFALSLYFLNKNSDRHVFEIIPSWESSTIRISNIQINKKALILFLTGFIGGILSAISGSGIDICSFAVLTLLFRVSEKTATPTSVVIMAINTCVGFFWRSVVQNEIDIESWKYFGVCIPVVVVGAPIGALISSYLNRLCLARMIYFLDGIQLIIAIIIIQPWNISIFLTISSIVIFILFVIIFFKISKVGLKIMNNINNSQ